MLLPTRPQVFFPRESLNNASDSPEVTTTPHSPFRALRDNKPPVNCMTKNVKMSLNYLTNIHFVTVVDLVT